MAEPPAVGRRPARSLPSGRARQRPVGFWPSWLAEQWQVAPDTLEVQNGTIANPATRQTLSYADLAKSKDVAAAFEQAVSPDVTVTPVAEWKVLGTPVARPNSRDLVTGRTSIRPTLPAPACCMAKSCVRPHMERRSNLSTSPKHKAMKDVVVVRDGQFVGCAAPSTFRAAQALAAIAKTASWKTAPHPSSKEIFTYLKEHAQGDGADANVEKALADATKARQRDL